MRLVSFQAAGSTAIEVGVLVGDMRATAAAFRLADVDRTLAWLEGATRGTP